MDPQCAYGSEPQPGADATFEWNASLLIELLPSPLNNAATIAALIAGIPLGVQQTSLLCATEFVSDPPTDEDWQHVTNPVGIVQAFADGGWDRVIGAVKRYVWAHYCQCKAPPDGGGGAGILFQQCWTDLSGTGTLGPFSIGGPYTLTAFQYYSMVPAHPVDDTVMVATLDPIPGSLDNKLILRSSAGDDAGSAGFTYPDTVTTAGTSLTIDYDGKGGTLSFCVQINGEGSAPPYEPDEPPDIPVLPDPTACSVDELCELLRRALAQTTINVNITQSQTDNINQTAMNTTNIAGDTDILRRGLLPTIYPTLEASGTLTGEGDWSSGGGGIGFAINVLSMPEGLGKTGVDLPAYYHLGYVQLAYEGGYSAKLPIVSNPTILVHVLPACLGLHYWLTEGASIQVNSLGPDPTPEA